MFIFLNYVIIVKNEQEKVWERNKNKIESRIEIIEAELKSNKELRTEIRLKEGLDKEKQTVKQINSKIKTILGEKKESMNSSVFNPVFEIQDLQDGLPMLDRILHVSLWKYFKENEMKTGYSDHRNISFSLMRTLDNITSAINFSVEHLSPHRNSQTRLYINDEHTNDIYNLIKQYQSKNKTVFFKNLFFYFDIFSITFFDAISCFNVLFISFIFVINSFIVLFI